MKFMRAFMGSVSAPAPAGQIVFDGNASSTVSNYSWVVPTGVTSICLLAVGSGSYGGGGLTYANFVSVTPGETLEISISSTGSNSSGVCRVRRQSDLVVLCEADPALGLVGGAAMSGPGWVSFKGGDAGTQTTTLNAVGKGGAAGYAGNGGNGGGNTAAGSGAATSSGGGGGGGGRSVGVTSGGGGGGVGLLGIGSTGSGGATATGGTGGSGGGDGGAGSPSATGGKYGGGGGNPANSGIGGIRIIWGPGRSFPSNAGDV